jgi:outer membrane protein TolC
MYASFPRRSAFVAVVTLLFALPGCALLESRARYHTLSRDYQRASEVAEITPSDVPFGGAATLERTALIAEVLRRNPTIAAARKAWRAALARYPQETALEDPMVGAGLGPRSFGSSQVEAAWRIEASQAFPFPGKLALRGAAALAEAEAMAHDYEAVRVRLAAMACALYDEAWLQARSLEITLRHLELVRDLHAAALGAYESGVGSQQDPLRAELEEAELLHQQVEIETTQRTTAAQLAALLHLGDGAAIPPLPEALPTLAAPSDANETLAEQALHERQELRAADARIAAKRAAEALARREFFPDFKIVGAYDAFWELPDQRPFVGLEWNVPLQIGRRRAALDQARAEAEQASLERQGAADEIRAEVESAAARLRESRHLLAITRDRMIPAARDGLAATRANYETGVAIFSDLIEAERALRNVELAEQRAVSEQSRRAAELLGALGIVPGAPPASVGPENSTQTPAGGSHD